MIKIENAVLPSPEQWEGIIRAMRNPLASWDRSDSGFAYEDTVPPKNQLCEPDHDGYVYSIGPNDHDLMMRLAKAGTDHRKFMRMIPVMVDITAPIYWLAELDTYKVGVVRNSCSFMHKGTARPFNITDFSIRDERIYKILTPLERKSYELDYPYETDEYRRFTDFNGRTYRVYRNGYVIREAFEYVDNYGSGRHRHFDEDAAVLYQTGDGYFIVKLSGRNGGHIPLHRMVAEVWCEKRDGATQVNHIDGNKGNNCAENLEWVTPSENMQHAVSKGLYEELGGLHKRYKLWKVRSHIIPIEKYAEFSIDIKKGMTNKELAEKWNITLSQAIHTRYIMENSEYEDLCQECYSWEQTLEQLNYLRSLYLETKDEEVFQSIRALLPQGYLQTATFSMNYEVLANIYRSRKNHRLTEWHDMCKWIESLPCSELITCVVEKE